MAADRELTRGPQHGEWIDAGVRCEAPILGGDQHSGVERVDPFGLDGQPPFAVRGQKAAQD
jgi:hypothetical protein